MYSKISDCIRDGNSALIRKLIRQALDGQTPALEILNRGLIPGMAEISVLFKNNEIYIPEVLVAANAMDAGIELLRPVLAQNTGSYIATVVIGTVKGDLHNIGKDLVAIMLEGAGFRVIDLGVDVPPETFVRAAQKYSAQIVAVSALLTTTMRMMKYTLDELQAAKLSPHIHTLIGGAPVTARFAQLIGADGYAEDAVSAVDEAKRLMNI
ncbi:cobalamin-binding protein [candidate division KSB1 bacterium]|nr:cobalamin-binding protein [candidate division KSB1 bacterium]